MNRFDLPVRVSGKLSCGCRFRPSKPMPMKEAQSEPGTVVICDKHDEFAIVVRVSTTLVNPREAIEFLLVEGDYLERDFAALVAHEQTA